jgi:hypothetical protein
MIIEFITPLVIASAPVELSMPEQKYNHATQRTEQVIAWDGTPQPYTRTPNGTRTYSGNGTPIDADND